MPELRIMVEAGSAVRRVAALRAWARSATGGSLVAGTAAETLVRRHVAGTGRVRHATAERLGARPTGHWDASLVALDGTAEGEARVRVAVPGAVRAYRDVELLPRRARRLAIPMHRLAYGVRPAELKRRMPVFVPRRRDGRPSDFIMGKVDGRAVPLYRRRDSVTQRRDPGLLPSDAEISAAASRALRIRARLIFGGGAR